jgi:O-antigen/teichoic acid export membrane protein
VDDKGDGRDGVAVDDEGDGRDETSLERWDRNFNELLQELRVAQTGVQILFAFLLTLPFTSRFGEVSRLDKVVYILTLIAAASATAFLIAPVSGHRQVFRTGRKPGLVRFASRLAKVGLVCLLVAVIGAVFLVLDFVAGLGWAVGISLVITMLYLALWYVLPHRIRESG